MGVKPENYALVMKSLFTLTNIAGALVTMPHKVATVALMDELSTTAQIAGSCNAIKRAKTARWRRHVRRRRVRAACCARGAR